MEIHLALTYTRPLLLNNGRLVNPLDPYARQIAALAGKRKKTDEDRVTLMQLEARGGCYETDEGLLGVANEMVWRSLYDAATAFKRGQDIKRALRAAPGCVPLLVAGAKVTVEDFLADPANIDYRAARPNRGRVMRARPIVRDWSSTHVFDLDESMMDARDLIPLVERAGSAIGIGNWRPTFGTYRGELR